MTLVPLNYRLLTVCFDNFIVGLFESPQGIVVVICGHASDGLLSASKGIVDGMGVEAGIVDDDTDRRRRLL